MGFCCFFISLLLIRNYWVVPPSPPPPPSGGVGVSPPPPSGGVGAGVSPPPLSGGVVPPEFGSVGVVGVVVPLFGSSVFLSSVLPPELPWPGQLSVGAVSVAKYSVIAGQLPATASFPVMEHTVFCSTEDGIVNSLGSRFSCTLLMMPCLLYTSRCV